MGFFARTFAMTLCWETISHQCGEPCALFLGTTAALPVSDLVIKRDVTRPPLVQA